MSKISKRTWNLTAGAAVFLFFVSSAVAQPSGPGAKPGDPAAKGPKPAPGAGTPAKPASPTRAEMKKLKERLAALTQQMQKIQAEMKRRRKVRSAKAVARNRKLKVKVEVLSDEVRKLRERLVLPETDKQKRHFGMGPSASKVYQLKKSGLSFGGYGEFYVDRKLKNKTDGKDFSTGDVYRYIQYVGFKFTDWLVMNAEIEFEHASTSSNYDGKGGSISVEFLYLDFMPHKLANVRAGLILVPMGFINELHEPPFYHGNLRPEVERQIIPSTWRELGLMVYGGFKGFSYKAWATNGLRGESFSTSGWRGGRQKGGRALTEDWGGGLRVDYSWKAIISFGASVYYGEADQQRILLNDEKQTARTLLVEGHAQFRYKGIELRALGAYGHLSNARDLTLALFPDSGDPTDPETSVLASSMYGYYVEAAYDFWRLFNTKRKMYLAPFIRFENYNTQAKTPSIAGRSADKSKNQYILDAGITFKPHPQVVLKVNYREIWNEASSKKADAVYFGAGFVY